jgi:hypothetical protein
MVDSCLEYYDDNKQVVVDDLDAWLENKYGLIILHLNIRSLNKHWEELKIVICNQLGNFDILILSEISVQVVEEIYCLDGYNSFCKTRKDKLGGGIMLFVKDNIHFVERHDVKSDNFESICGLLETCQTKNKILLLAVYRPPDKNKTKFIEEIETFVVGNEDKSYIIIVGDMNLNLLNGSNKWIQVYENIFASNGYQKCIYGTTREEFRSTVITSTCIDHIFIKSTAKQISSAINTIKISDHYLVAAIIHFCSDMSQITEIPAPPVTFLNEHVLKNKLLSVNWESMMSINDCTELYETVVSNFEHCYEAARRIKEPNKNIIKKKWITPELLKMTHEKYRLFKKWKYSKSSLKLFYRNQYNEYRNNVNKQIVRAKNQYYQGRIENAKGDCKATW